LTPRRRGLITGEGEGQIHLGLNEAFFTDLLTIFSIFGSRDFKTFSTDALVEDFLEADFLGEDFLEADFLGEDFLETFLDFLTGLKPLFIRLAIG
jgi:hypothetical protein